MKQTENGKIRILLVDDHAVVRAGYQMLLKQSDKIEISAEAASGEQAGKLFSDLNPDVVVMDLSLPGISGLEAIRRIIRKDANAKILVFSMHEDTVFVDQALRAGARGYLTKNSAPRTLVKAIEELAAGRIYIDERVAQHLAFQKARDEVGPFASLSTREFEIFCLLAEGLNTNEIATRLSIGYKTVANYSSQIKNKLQTNTTAELARLAIRHNILQA
ncbi:MAG: response regulator transcription factor [Gammaproteobacteria bacterium]|nr:response regulator transcription factor [Gammaproteobacteria bacterium]MCY4210498.1 response regulator transcription factor [Gammaproteobacteria bacterium]MCY4283481.1 response regulator transcription factor [Gammaproteobacteria bacterium]MCY4337260.1 response regulator transcription factor [Gammaproteobacteria bacterium]